MARNKVMKLWTAVVTAFLALCAALGFATSAAAAPVSPPQSAHDSGAQVSLPRQVHGNRFADRSLPPTMKQRIRAEAHGASPACRHRQLTATAPTTALAHYALRARDAPTAFHDLTVRLRR
jgi:Spy/CpxP family protein refolding chaperone